MGIPQYFGWLSRKYDNIIQLKPENIEHLYFDFNCLIYHVYGNIIKEHYSTFKEFNENQRITYLLDKVESYLKSIIKEVNPQKSISICVDGVVPMAKMHRQRQRRYKSPIMKEWENELKRRFDIYQEELFDTNQITPGTPFMMKLSEKLRSISYPKPVTISDANQYGEGEHKILRLIREDKVKGKICIYGLDADLIMLSLSLDHEVSLLRENTHVGAVEERFGQVDFLTINVLNLKDCIFKEMMKSLSEKFNVKSFSFTKEKLIKDYVFIGMFLGNDFLHTLPSVSIQNNGSDFLIKVYSQCFAKCRNYLTYKVNGNTKINKGFLMSFFDILARAEPSSLKAMFHRKKIPNPPNFDDTYSELKWKMDRIPFNERFKDNFSVIDYNRDQNWKRKYYDIFFDLNISNDFDKENVKEICQNYLEGIYFTMKYYFDGEDHWEWYNPYFVSPFASDISNYLKEKDINSVKLDKGTPFTPLEQLMLVLPRTSFSHLPDCLVNGINEKLVLYYPDEFGWCAEEKFMVYSIEPKLPLFNLEKVREVFKEEEGKLNEIEKTRNSLSEIFRKNF